MVTMVKGWRRMSDEQPRLGADIVVVLANGVAFRGKFTLEDKEFWIEAGKYGNFNASLVTNWIAAPHD